MFRLADYAFSGSLELETLARYCLTETIKHHLRTYFEEGFEGVPEEQLYRKVNAEKVKRIFPGEFHEELGEIQHDADRFLQKKVARFWQILASEEEFTPDLFTEYLLYCMIQFTQNFKKENPPLPTAEEKKKLKKLLKSYVQNDIDFEEDDEEVMKELEIEYFHVLTDMRYLMGYPEPSDNGVTFWDWDFLLFDEAGILNTLRAFANGPLAQEGYDIDAIFTSVGEPAPMIDALTPEEKQH